MALCFCCAVCGAAVLVFVDVLYSTEYVFIRTTGRGSVDGTRSIVSSSLHTLYGFSLSPFVRYALFLFPIPYTGLSPYSSICTSLLGAVRGTECDSEIWRHIRACLPQCFCENNIPWHEERLKGVVKWQLQTCRSSSVAGPLRRPCRHRRVMMMRSMVMLPAAAPAQGRHSSGQQHDRAHFCDAGEPGRSRAPWPALASASTCSSLAHNVSGRHPYGSCWRGGTLRDVVKSVRI